MTNFALYSNNICHIGDLGYGVFTSESTCRQACANRDDCASYTYFGTTCSLSSRAAMSYISAYIGAFCGIKDSTCSSYNGEGHQWSCSSVSVRLRSSLHRLPCFKVAGS